MSQETRQVNSRTQASERAPGPLALPSTRHPRVRQDHRTGQWARDKGTPEQGEGRPPMVDTLSRSPCRNQGWGTGSHGSRALGCEVGPDAELAAGPTWDQFPRLSCKAAVRGLTTWGRLREKWGLGCPRTLPFPLRLLLLCREDLTR